MGRIGKIIVIEGVDFVGKETAINTIVSNDMKYKACVPSYPQDTRGVYDKADIDYISDRSNKKKEQGHSWTSRNVNMKSVGEYFKHYAKTIYPDLCAGKHVLVRGWPTEFNEIHRSYSGRYAASLLPQIEMRIYLLCSNIKDLQKRMMSIPKDDKRKKYESIETYKRINESYSQRAKFNGEVIFWIETKGMDKDSVANTVYKTIKEQLVE